MTVTAAELHAATAAFRREARHAVFDTGRYRMRYFIWGSGPPLVFVHGMAGGADQFMMVMHRLAGRFSCVGYELPDGVSDGSALGRYTHREYVADLLALLDHLGHVRANVLGSSFGSTITLSALAAAPDRFDRAVLQGGFARRPLTPGELWAGKLGQYLPGYFGDYPAIYREIVSAGNERFRAAVPPEVWESFVACGAATTNRAAAVRGLTIARTDLRPLLPAIRTPLLMLGGDRDELVPRWCEAEVEKGVTGARRVEFAGCGHYPQYTQPGRMADVVAGFLSAAPT